MAERIDHIAMLNRWRSAHMDELLADEDAVNALPEGTVVEVVWSGGNGPHGYTVVKDGDVSCVDTIYRDPITFVGRERFQTNVRVVPNPQRDDLTSRQGNEGS